MPRPTRMFNWRFILNLTARLPLKKIFFITTVVIFLTMLVSHHQERSLKIYGMVMKPTGSHGFLSLSRHAFRGKTTSKHASIYKYGQLTRNVSLGVFVTFDIERVGRLSYERLWNHEFGFSNCYKSDGGNSAVNGYRLYVICTGNGNATLRSDNRRLLSFYLAERIRMLTQRGCQVTMATYYDAVENGGDVRSINDAMIGAYINDQVDYFHVILPDAQTPRGNSLRTGDYLVHLLRYGTSLYETGIVIENQPSANNSIESPPLAIFFTRVHFEIFGLFFPINLDNLYSAVSLLTSVYESTSSSMKFVVRVNNITSDGEHTMITTNPNTSSTTAKTNWPDFFREDSETLSRYISVVNSTGCYQCVLTSSKSRIISMSLYGSSRRYTVGAVRNAQLAPVIYPGWTLRFYTELPDPTTPITRLVPSSVIRRLRELGADVFNVPNSSRLIAPMLWRFTVLLDPTVDIFIVRDCDSRLTPRDAATVNDWLKQKTNNSVFHCIRDHPSHSHHAVSGGLWGGRRAALMGILSERIGSSMSNFGGGYLEDMNFLGRDVWPRVVNNSYCHDSFSCTSFSSSHPFPVTRIGTEHLGQVYNQFSVGRQSDINILVHAPVNRKCIPHYNTTNAS